MTLRVEMRAAVVGLLETYAASLPQPLKLQVWPGRPASIHPPTAFVEDTREERLPYGDSSTGAAVRTAQMDVVLLHGPRLPGGGSFDSSDAVGQADRIVDGVTALVDATTFAIGGNTTLSAVRVQDISQYVPDWIGGGGGLERDLASYYATRITLEAYSPSLTI
jgi:hypothetical protein